MSTEIVEIGLKLRSGSQLLIEVNECLSVTKHDWLKEALENTSKLLQNWEKEWHDKVVTKGLDLGSITSYAGSVFNPQEIPVAQMTLCVISDMEMFIKDIKEMLIKDATLSDDREVISKLVCVLATFQFINQSWSNGVVAKLEENDFPCTKLNSLSQTITQQVPNFDKILETIGM